MRKVILACALVGVLVDNAAALDSISAMLRIHGHSYTTQKQGGDWTIRIRPYFSIDVEGNKR